jgi:hypothetical protein
MSSELSLAETIALVEAGLEDVDRAVGTYEDDPHGFHARLRGEMTALCGRLESETGARVSERGDTTRVRMSGLTSTSTCGIRARFATG